MVPAAHSISVVSQWLMRLETVLGTVLGLLFGPVRATGRWMRRAGSGLATGLVTGLAMGWAGGWAAGWAKAAMDAASVLSFQARLLPFGLVSPPTVWLARSLPTRAPPLPVAVLREADGVAAWGVKSSLRSAGPHEDGSPFSLFHQRSATWLTYLSQRWLVSFWAAEPSGR